MRSKTLNDILKLDVKERLTHKSVGEGGNHS